MVHHRPRRPGGLPFYIAAWLGAGAAVVVAAALILDRGGAPATSVSLPPVHERELGAAARKAGCTVAGRRRTLSGDAVAAQAARPGIYTRPVSDGARERSVRAGIIVVEYRPDASDGERNRLGDLQRSMPAGTVLAPSAALRANQLSVTTYGRQLRCREITPRALEALQLFRGRYLGSGPGA
ncbi:DUF3105 domain-containing protein [Baekduia soli]|uniref:DUF3105 domain-containing protein n=1 Tax=Baekduia soli TaxID=496014 RepID=A0A5B8U5X3_9ACTN|nr:DUF3105 domain-containing protein [Baekduia soli]QEC48285.1 DUF3105 domain-containing protein [Baekduia soli]